MPNKVVSSKESLCFTPFTESDQNHDVDKTDLNILSLFIENPVPINSDFSSILHTKQDLLTMQLNDPNLEKSFSMVRSQSEDANGHSSFFHENYVLIRVWRDKCSSNFDESEATQTVAS